MVNAIEFKVMCVKKSFSFKQIAEACNLTYSGLSDKLKNKTEFKPSEICVIQNLAGLSDQERKIIFGI